jgi:hypothetical protein
LACVSFWATVAFFAPDAAFAAGCFAAGAVFLSPRPVLLACAIRGHPTIEGAISAAYGQRKRG